MAIAGAGLARLRAALLGATVRRATSLTKRGASQRAAEQWSQAV